MKNQNQSNSNAWNFDKLEGIKTTSSTQKNKKVKKTVSLDLNSTADEVEVPAVALKKTPEAEIKIEKEDKKQINPAAQHRDIEFNALLKKPSNSVEVEEEIIEAPVAEDNSLMKNWSASQDNKDSLEEIKRKNAETRPFEMVAYKEPQNQKSLVTSQMGSFLFSFEKIVPEPLKGTSWEKSSEEQKKLAIKLTLTVLLSLSMITGILVGKGLNNSVVEPSSVVATTSVTPTIPTVQAENKQIEKEVPSVDNKKVTDKKTK